MCRVSPVFDFEVDITKAKDNTDEGGMRYIDSISKDHQEKLLGISGRNDVKAGKANWKEYARGWSGETFKPREPKENK